MYLELVVKKIQVSISSYTCKVFKENVIYPCTDEYSFLPMERASATTRAQFL